MKSLGRKIRNNITTKLKKIYKTSDIDKLRKEVLSKNFVKKK
jgi:hypothetical protein